VASIIEQLLVLQDRDRKLMRLQREIDDLPERQAMIEAPLEAYQQAIDRAEEDIRNKKKEQNDLEAQIEQRRERIKKFRQQQMEVKNNDDYRTFETQIKKLETEITSLEDKELELMEALEGLETVRAEKQAAWANEKEGIDADLADVRQRAANIEQEYEAVKADRAKLAEGIDPDWLARYDRVFQHHRDYALVSAENNTCGGCHMKLPPQAAHDARKLDSMTTCMYCGRLLYSLP